MTTPPNREIEEAVRVARDVVAGIPGLNATTDALAQAVLELAARVEKMERVCEAARVGAKSKLHPRGPLVDGTGDWSCAECRPHSDILVDGFQCWPHALLSALAALTPTTTEET